jgi:hypothetical protein
MSRGRIQGVLALSVVLGLVFTACGDDDDQVFGTSASTAAGTAADDESPGASTGALEPYNEWEFVLNYEFDPNPPPPESDLGAADIPLAEQLTAELMEAAGDLTGIEFWVFDVVGSEDRLLVMDVGSDEPLPDDEDSEDPDIIGVLAQSETFLASGITQLVVNFHLEDETGSYILNSIVPFDALVAGAGEDGIDADSLLDIASLQILDSDGLPATISDAAPSTTSSTTTTTIAEDTPLLVETFDGEPTTAVPLFGPGVMSVNETADGTLAMTVFTTGVIPAMYPDPLPAEVIISFDIKPTPIGEGTAFGALVLADDPKDGALDHYVVVWAGLSDNMLAIVPYDGATGGFGDAVFAEIPPEVGWEADEWIRLTVEVRNGAIGALLNFQPIAAWSGPPPVTSGYWGPVILGANPGDLMQVDNVVVREPTE